MGFLVFLVKSAIFFANRFNKSHFNRKCLFVRLNSKFWYWNSYDAKQSHRSTQGMPYFEFLDFFRQQQRYKHHFTMSQLNVTRNSYALTGFRWLKQRLGSSCAISSIFRFSPCPHRLVSKIKLNFNDHCCRSHSTFISKTFAVCQNEIGLWIISGKPSRSTIYSFHFEYYGKWKINFPQKSHPNNKRELS